MLSKLLTVACLLSSAATAITVSGEPQNTQQIQMNHSLICADVGSKCDPEFSGSCCNGSICSLSAGSSYHYCIVSKHPKKNKDKVSSSSSSSCHDSGESCNSGTCCAGNSCDCDQGGCFCNAVDPSTDDHRPHPSHNDDEPSTPCHGSGESCNSGTCCAGNSCDCDQGGCFCNAVDPSTDDHRPHPSHDDDEPSTPCHGSGESCNSGTCCAGNSCNCDQGGCFCF